MCKAGFNSTTGAVHGGVQTQAPCIHALEKDEPAPFTSPLVKPKLSRHAGARSEIRDAHGVKIYFDPVSTGARQVDARQLARAVLADKDRANDIDTVGALNLSMLSCSVGRSQHSGTCHMTVRGGG